MKIPPLDRQVCTFATETSINKLFLTIIFCLPGHDLIKGLLRIDHTDEVIVL